MNALLQALKRWLQWQLLAIVDRPFEERRPTDQELKAHLESLSFREQLKLGAIVNGLEWIDTVAAWRDEEGNHGRKSA